MFENVGLDSDPEAGRRRFTASLITFGLLGIAGLAVASWATKPLVLAKPAQSVTMVEFDLPSEEPDLPDLPPKARLGGGEQARKGTEKAPSPDHVVEPTEVIAPFTPTPIHTEIVNVNVQGTARGTGEADTTKKGPPGPGLADGDVHGRDKNPNGVDIVPFTELNIRKRIDPIYPPTSTDSVTCRIRVLVQADGKPGLIRVGGCPEVFQNATRNAMIRWKWSKPKVDGKNVPVETTYTIRYEPAF